MANRCRYSQELEERAVRLVADHENQRGSQWEKITSAAEKIGSSAERLSKWIRQAERDARTREKMTSDEREQAYYTQEETPAMAAEVI